MRLINTTTLALREFWGNDTPRYAILSHTWEEEEITYQQFTQLSHEELAKFKGFDKIRRTCQLAQHSKIEWAWVDTCCIDKSSSAELTEAINSMFRWYAESAVCYAYLSDLVGGTRRRNEGGRDRKQEEEETRRKREEERKRRDEEDGSTSRERRERARHDGKRKDEPSPGPSDAKDKHGGTINWDIESDARTEASDKNESDGRLHERHRRDSSSSSSTFLTATRRREEARRKTPSPSPSRPQPLDPLSRQQRIEKLARCRWFTRGWTLQELIAPRLLGFYNSTWRFQGEKSTLAPELSEITHISPRVLTNAALLATIPVAQRMSWAATRQTTRAEDLAYCLLGLFHVQIPLLYGEGGTKAFVRLQEEIIKESNDLSLFAWRTPPTAAHPPQKHVGVLALSPQAFASSGDISLWDDPMYNDEVAVTSKGLRVTPVSGGSLSASVVDAGTYVLNLRCYHSAGGPSTEDRDIGIYLRQHGCDVYTRVLPDTLAEVTTTDVPEARGRTFYISKMVSPVLSVVLGSSHRNAIDVTRARAALERAGFWLRREAGKGGIEPVGHWDAQRGVFLTQGMREFACRLTFGHKVERAVTVDCVLRGGRVVANLAVGGASAGEVVRGEVLRKRDGKGRAAEWLAASVVVEAVRGQPVFFVEVEVKS
ncbi:heterokaryon incompatibility protein-domain-containing protein [Schizothecium vesticola]|uniref:Heterokaryon incompatibility protein-domain-containing protein n=1 Tax=Schizothecium vesticola TaxID=314040 RepID=A0AA40F7S5_9PEZI|nr:heterokaryon incompatibility protein-domain-containing protein [Schizothecium vesticola]